MEKRGTKPKGKVELKWSSDFAYAIGLLVTDGCLSNNGRHIIFVSKDDEQIRNFLRALKIKDIKVGRTYSRSSGKKKWYHRVQFGDVLFYKFLLELGLTPAKSRTLKSIQIPDEYFFDYLRGCFDGDGCSYSYWDPRWKSSFMLYLAFVSASRGYILWLQNEIFAHLEIKGHITSAKKKDYYYQLKFAKNDSLVIIKRMYENPQSLYLKRKKLKIDDSLAIIEGLKSRT